MTPAAVDIWRRLHRVADRVPDTPRHLWLHIELLVDRIEQLVDSTDDNPTPKKGNP